MTLDHPRSWNVQRRGSQGRIGKRIALALHFSAAAFAPAIASSQEVFAVGPPPRLSEQQPAEPAPHDADARTFALQELPRPHAAQEPQGLPGAPAEAASLQELPLPAATPAASAGETAIDNDGVVEMVRAGLGDSTIVAAIGANPTRFDVAPKALVTLKGAGVSEHVIEAMIAATSAEVAAAIQPAAQATPAASATAADAAAAPAEMSPETIAALSQVIERLAAQSAATKPEPESAEEPEQKSAGGVPRAWVDDGEDKSTLTPTIAQVAMTETKRSGGTALRTLKDLGGKALAFANPAFQFASGLGGLFRPNDPATTAVWALLGPTAARTFDHEAAFEIEFGAIPGVNPDEYRPAIVQLVPTNDNYRLVGAAKTSADDEGGTPSGPIIEEPVPAQLTQLARGHYRVALGAQVPPGEYALVLRPVTQERERRRDSDESLGDLMGGSASQILYMTWDFSIQS
jgi:hypothetical protein